MRTTAWIGIDIGTSGTKAIAVDDNGNVVGRGTVRHPTNASGSRHEQDANHYVSAARTALEHCWTGDVAGIGVVGQTPTLVLVDAHGVPVRPAITWQDSRATAEAEELRDLFPSSLASFGVDNQLDATQIPAKLLWLSRNERHALEETRWLLLPKDYLGMELTGVAATDVWSSKGLYSVTTLEAVSELFSLAGIPQSLAPTIQDPWSPLGTTTSAAAELFGVAEGVPVAVGWSDALSGMLAIGAATNPMSFILAGTSDVVGTSKLERGPAIDGLYQVPQSCAPLTIDYGPTQSSGASLVWLSRITGTSVSDLASMAAESRPTEALFVPYLNGERAPIWDRRARASFTCLSDGDGLPETAFAVMRGVALSGQHVLETSWGKGDPPNEIHLGGANVEERAWIRSRQAVHSQRLVIHQEPQLPALGAAMLARTAATGCSLADAYSSMHGAIRIIDDHVGDAEPARRLYDRYRRDVSRAIEACED